MRLFECPAKLRQLGTFEHAGGHVIRDTVGPLVDDLVRQTAHCARGQPFGQRIDWHDLFGVNAFALDELPFGVDHHQLPLEKLGFAA